MKHNMIEDLKNNCKGKEQQVRDIFPSKRESESRYLVSEERILVPAKMCYILYLSSEAGGIKHPAP